MLFAQLGHGYQSCITCPTDECWIFGEQTRLTLNSVFELLKQGAVSHMGESVAGRATTSFLSRGMHCIVQSKRRSKASVISNPWTDFHGVIPAVCADARRQFHRRFGRFSFWRRHAATHVTCFLPRAEQNGRANRPSRITGNIQTRTPTSTSSWNNLTRGKKGRYGRLPARCPPLSGPQD